MKLVPYQINKEREMFNIKNWFKSGKNKNSEQESKLANSQGNPNSNTFSQKEINDLRQAEFERLGIPYQRVILAEAHGVKNINPRKLVTETDDLNAKLISLGFAIKISYLESFESQLLYLDYQKIRHNKQASSGILLPDRSLIDVIVLKEAEKIIRNKYKLSENPTSGPLVEKFQTEVKQAIEFLFKKSLNYQLRYQAQGRIRHENNLPKNAIIPEIDILAMMDKIQQKK